MFNYAISNTAFKTIVKNIPIPFIDSSMTKEWIQVQGSGVKVKANPQVVSDTTMPNIVGMKLQDALWICEKKGLQVKCQGKGKVVSQSIAQGQSIIKGQQIQIQLNAN